MVELSKSGQIAKFLGGKAFKINNVCSLVQALAFKILWKSYLYWSIGLGLLPIMFIAINYTGLPFEDVTGEYASYLVESFMAIPENENLEFAVKIVLIGPTLLILIGVLTIYFTFAVIFEHWKLTILTVVVIVSMFYLIGLYFEWKMRKSIKKEQSEFSKVITGYMQSIKGKFCAMVRFVDD